MAGRSSPSNASEGVLPTHIGNRKKSRNYSSADGASTGTDAGAGGGIVQRTSTHRTHHSTASKTARTPKWWKIRLFRGMINDLRRRAPFYASDWKDAWDYRVVPATIYMYFAKYVFSINLSHIDTILFFITEHRPITSTDLTFVDAFPPPKSHYASQGHTYTLFVLICYTALMKFNDIFIIT